MARVTNLRVHDHSPTGLRPNSHHASEAPIRRRRVIIKAGLVLGISIFLGISAWQYFGPFNSCLRDGWSPKVCETLTSQAK
jgi:hypothetical protein